MTPPITSISLSPSCTKLALATDDSLLIATPPAPPPDPTSPPIPLPPPVPHSLSNISSLCLPSSDVLYTATTRSTLTRYDVSERTPTTSFSIAAAHSTHALTSVAALSPSSLVATGAKDGLIKLWDPSAGVSTAKLAAHRYEVRSVALAASFDGDTAVTLIASAGRDRTVRLWDARTDKPVATLKGHSGWVHSVALASAPSPIAVSCSGDKSVRVWDLLTMSQRRVFTGHEYRVWDVDVPANATYCVSCSTDFTVRAWEIGGDDTYTFDVHNEPVSCVAAARDGRFVVSGCDDGSVLIWGSNGLFGHQAEEEKFVGSEKEPVDETLEKPPEHSELVDVGDHIHKSFEGIPKQMDTTPLVAVDAAEMTTTQMLQQIVEHTPPTPVETTASLKLTETPERPKSKQLPVQREITETLKAAIAVPPEQAPEYDKSAAELVRALQRISELENSLREANDAAAVRERELSALKASLVERDATITRLKAEVESSKALVREANVRALLDTNPRKADVALDYDEPVNKIGAVSDKLSRLAARLDAMIATN